MDADIVGIGVAASIPEPTGNRIERAGLQFLTKHTLGHMLSLPDRSRRGEAPTVEPIGTLQVNSHAGH